MASLAPGWHSGLPELLSVSRLGDGVGGQLHRPTWPLGSPATQSSAPVTEEGQSPALGGSPSLPPSHLYTSCLWVVLPTVLKATHTFPCLLFGSPARSPSPPRPACWPGPDTFLLPDPHAPTHTALHECLPTVS